MEAHNRFYRCFFEWERSLFQFVGLDFFEEKLKITPKTLVTFGIFVPVFIMEIYTFIYYGFLERVFIVHAFSIAIQGLVKLSSARNFDDMQYLNRFIQNLYKIHITTQSRDRTELFKKFSLISEFVFVGFAILYILAVIMFFLLPIYVYYTQHKLIAIIPMYMPGIDETTLEGYIFLIIIQIFIVAVCVIGFLACDYYFAVVIISSLILAKLISFDMDQIHIDLEENDAALTARARFRNILQMHQQVFEYMERVEKTTFQIYLAQVSGASVCSVVIAYAILAINYLPFYCLLAGMLIEIFMACLLGNFVELTFDQIYDSALNLKWNEMPAKEQHLYKFFICRCQNPTLLSIGGVAPLNLDTCVKIFNKIYSITMVMNTMGVE